MPFGAELGDRRDARFRLWAPGAAQRRARACARREAPPVLPMRCARRRLVRAQRRWRRRRRALPLSHRRRITRARPGLALQAARTCTARATSSTRRVRLARRRVARPAVGRGGDLRAARRHLHAGGHVRRASIERLDDLVALGVTAIELMPVADFPGTRNWGYDGVLPFAPDASYGTPEDLKRLVDAAHARGLMVLLDVVYNHFGPGGQLPARLRAAVLQPRASDAVGRGDQLRRRAKRARCATSSSTTRSTGSRNSTSTACASTRCTRSSTTRSRTSSTELAHAVRAGPARARHVHLVLENDATRRATSRATHRDARRSPTAQWNDDLHHALHVLRPARRDGYYADYAGEPLRDARPRARRRLRLPGRSVAVSRRRAARRAQRASAAAGVRHRSRRTTTRSATARSASASRRWRDADARCAR